MFKKIKIKRFDKDIPLPAYQTKGAVAFDLVARETVEIKPGLVGYVPLNVAVETPADHVLFVAARGSTHKFSVFPVNGIAIGDPDFRGDKDEYTIPLLNFTKKTVTIHRGTRIAQGFFVKFLKAKWQEVKKWGLSPAEDMEVRDTNDHRDVIYREFPALEIRYDKKIQVMKMYTFVLMPENKDRKQLEVLRVKYAGEKLVDNMPPHITLKRRFTLKGGKTEIEIKNIFHNFQIPAVAVDFNSVEMLDDAFVFSGAHDELTKIHKKLIIALRDISGTTKNPEWENDNYKIHMTLLRADKESEKLTDLQPIKIFF